MKRVAAVIRDTARADESQRSRLLKASNQTGRGQIRATGAPRKAPMDQTPLQRLRIKVTIDPTRAGIEDAVRGNRSHQQSKQKRTSLQTNEEAPGEIASIAPIRT